MPGPMGRNGCLAFARSRWLHSQTSPDSLVSRGRRCAKSSRSLDSPEDLGPRSSLDGRFLANQGSLSDLRSEISSPTQRCTLFTALRPAAPGARNAARAATEPDSFPLTDRDGTQPSAEGQPLSSHGDAVLGFARANARSFPLC